MNRKLLSTTGNSVWNQAYMDSLETYFFNSIDVSTIHLEQDTFLEKYPEWIASSKLNKFTGLDAFPYKFVSLGVTQGLEWWQYYCLANQYRLRTLKGEYPYTRDTLLTEWTDSNYIDCEELLPGDAVLISVPFSGNGKKHDRWDEIMMVCNDYDIPVFVDCAWFGTCYDIEVNLNEPCIKMVAFSTTKGLSCGNWRSGIVFSKIEECSLNMQTEWRHGIHLNVAIANHLMMHFTPDTIPKKYMDAQQSVCKLIDLEPSNTIHVAIAPNTEEWQEFSRDGVFSRVNIRDAIKQYHNKGHIR